jgi:hypothetical protein
VPSAIRSSDELPARGFTLTCRMIAANG